MTSARIYDSWEEEQAANAKVKALARRSSPDDLLSELLPARPSQRANAATVMQVLSEYMVLKKQWPPLLIHLLPIVMHIHLQEENKLFVKRGEI